MAYMQYVISGGQLYIDKKVFALEMLSADSMIKKLMKVNDMNNDIPPKITKTEDYVILDYNNASDIEVNQNYEEMFQRLKSRYKEKLKGKLTLRINILTPYHFVLDFNREDDKISRE
jgi:hypothetical protein